MGPVYVILLTHTQTQSLSLLTHTQTHSHKFTCRHRLVHTQTHTHIYITHLHSMPSHINRSQNLLPENLSHINLILTPFDVHKFNPVSPSAGQYWESHTSVQMLQSLYVSQRQRGFKHQNIQLIQKCYIRHLLKCHSV